MFKEMDIEDWVHKIQSTPSGKTTDYLGMSPGGVAAVLRISRQAVHDAINRDRMDAWRLTREGKLVAILIPDHDVENYRLHHLRKSA